MFSLWSRRGRIVLGALGLVLVSVPVAGVPLLVSMHTRDVAERTVNELASEYVGRAENALDSGLETLGELSALGVAACGQRELDLMRRTVYANFWIKEVAIARPTGEVLCNHIGDSNAVERLSTIPSPGTDLSLSLVEVGTTERRGLMLARTFSTERALTATVPGDALAAEIVPRQLKGFVGGSIALSDGSIVGAFAPDGELARDNPTGSEAVSTTVASDTYPIVVSLTVPLSVVARQYDGLFTYAQYGAILLSAMVFGLFVYVLRGPPAEVARLRDAVDRGEIVPYYQPVIDLATGRLVGCEVLMRWQKPNGTIATPDEFIRLAETSEIGWPLTLNLMRQVRHDLERSFGERPTLKIAINLFNAHFGRLRTVTDVESIFGGSTIAFSQLVFELTEREPLGDIDRARVVIRRLQDLGARVALDDAGTGHSGLAYLHQLGVNMVKIDKLFVDTIGEGRTPTPIIDSLIRLAHVLGMEVVAEGVETFQQVDYLRERGADMAQGYLFAPPLPVRAFLDMVRAMEPLPQPRAVPAAGMSAGTAKVA